MKKILIVEDRIILRKNLKTLLETSEHIIYEAKNGIQGAARAILENPDLIITDNHMPKMNGAEMIQKLKKYPQTSSIPLIGWGSFNEQERTNLNYFYDKTDAYDGSQMIEEIKELLE